MISSVYIAKNVYGGDGLGRLGDGRVVFVPGAFAGESVKAEFVEERNNYVKARLVAIDEPSPARTGTATPPIPGMVYANLTPQGEMAIKEAQLKEFLERNRFDPKLLLPTTPPKHVLNYRNKVVYHFEKKGQGWVLGYRVEPSHEIQEIVEDPLACPEINAKLPEIRRHVMMLLTQGAPSVRQSVAKKANVTIRYTPKSGVQWWLGGDAPANLVLKETTAGHVFEVPADGFYQVNPEMGEELVRAVQTAFRTHPTAHVLDLYCGVGVFGLCLNPQNLTGIESGRTAVAFAKRNAANLHQPNACFFAQEVGRNLKRMRVTPDTTIVVDPPRGGLERPVPAWLARSGAARIFYVSCDPATLMRDLKVIAHGYEIESVKWLNMFPRTARFETLVVLKKRA